MKQKTAFMAMLLLSALAQADVFKCKTSGGIIYSERPCPAGSIENNIQVSQPSNQKQTPDSLNQRAAAPQQTSQTGINNVNAVPLPNPATQRQAYVTFLSRPSPRAFVICKDGRVMTFGGKEDFVRQKLSDLPGGCVPYTVNDDVVWAGN